MGWKRAGQVFYLVLLLLGCGEKLDPVSAGRDYAKDLPVGLAPADICYENHVSPLISHYCLSCHQPGGTGVTKSDILLDSYDMVKSNIDKVMVQVESGNMPKGRDPLRADQIALLGVWRGKGFQRCATVNTSGDLPLWVIQNLPDSLKTSVCYVNHIKPILRSSRHGCISCHYGAGGEGTDSSGVVLFSYNDVKKWIDGMITATSDDFMPAAGRGFFPLDSGEKAILRFWRATGMPDSCN